MPYKSNIRFCVKSAVFLMVILVPGKSQADDAWNCFGKANAVAKTVTNDAPYDSPRYKQAYHEAYKMCMPSQGVSTPTKKAPATENKTSKSSDSAATGKILYQAWDKKFPSVRTKVWGGATNSPSVELCVPAQLWNKATKQQRISLTYYAESMTSGVKSNPDSEAWIDVPGGRGSAAFEFQSKKLANIQPGAWFISTARMKPGSYDTVSCEDMPVMGDYEWQQEFNKRKENGWKLPPETAKASIFRK